MPMEMLRAAKVKSCNRYALLSGDRSEIDRLYADALFKFSFSEFLIYQAGRFGLMRDLARSIFEWRYTAYHRGACGS
jgi:hypothetical protein